MCVWKKRKESSKEEERYNVRVRNREAGNRNRERGECWNQSREEVTGTYVPSLLTPSLFFFLLILLNSQC